jgi:hypothetical protein
MLTTYHGLMDIDLIRIDVRKIPVILVGKFFLKKIINRFITNSSFLAARVKKNKKENIVN